MQYKHAYISGPMTGYANYNRAAFEEAEELLKKILSETRSLCHGEIWMEMVKFQITILNGWLGGVIWHQSENRAILKIIK